MHFDKQRLQQVVLNLMKNAIKFSHIRGEVITVTAQIIDKAGIVEGKQLRVSVQDRGIGILNSETMQIFTPLFKTKDQKRRQINVRGNGLGLSICKHICESLGGAIEVRSDKGLGSTFTITIDVF